MTSAAGILLAAHRRGELAPISWAVVDCGDGLVVTVSADALRAVVPEHSPDPVRWPVSYAEAIEIDQDLGCVAPTAQISDAIWRAATVRCSPIGLVQTAADTLRMTSVDFTLRHHANVERDIAATRAAVEIGPCVIIADVGKDWILDNALGLGRVAVNYGWRRATTGHPIQPVGQTPAKMHDAEHAGDYSQSKRVVLRTCVYQGESADLLDVTQSMGIQRRWLDVYR